MKTLTLDSKTIEALAGPLDESLKLIEERFDVSVSARGSALTIQGNGDGSGRSEERVADLFHQLASLHEKGVPLGRDDVKTAVSIMAREDASKLAEHFLESRLKPSARKTVVAKSPNQRHYVDAMRANDLVFGVGPAGTGKTYLAVAMAITLLNEKRIQRILLCRPAVEKFAYLRLALERAAKQPGRSHRIVDLAEPVLQLPERIQTLFQPRRIARTKKLQRIAQPLRGQP